MSDDLLPFLGSILRAFAYDFCPRRLGQARRRTPVDEDGGGPLTNHRGQQSGPEHAIP